MGAAAELDRIGLAFAVKRITQAQHTHAIAILLTKQRERAFLDRRLRRHFLEHALGVLPDHGVHLIFDALDFLSRHRLSVAEVEAEAIGFDERALLRDMRPQHIAQRRMQQVRRRVVGADLCAARVIDFQRCFVADLDRAFR
jgi:hypothetical protein